MLLMEKRDVRGAGPTGASAFGDGDARRGPGEDPDSDAALSSSSLVEVVRGFGSGVEVILIRK